MIRFIAKAAVGVAATIPAARVAGLADIRILLAEMC